MKKSVCNRLFGFVLVGVIAVSSVAWAADTPPLQSGQGMDAHLFRTAVDTKGHFSVDATSVQPHLSVSLGMVLGFAFDLYFAPELEGEAHNRTKANPMMDVTLLFNLGLFDRLVVGAQLPIALPAGTYWDDTALEDDAEQEWSTKGEFGDVVLHVKIPLLRAGMHMFGMGLLLQYATPSGAQRFLVGEPGAGAFVGKFIVDVEPTSWYRAALNVGARVPLGWESDNHLDIGSNPLAFHYGPVGIFGLGQSFSVIPTLMDLVVEVYGAQLLTEFGNSRYFSMEANVGAKIFLEENSYLMAGYAHGIPTANTESGYGFQNAVHRMFLGFAFEPSMPDMDGDGISDADDECPYVPEDRDGFEDSDGCPENDNDRDGIPDDMDHCPLVPEDFDDDLDGDGCPDAEIIPEPNDRDADRIFDENDQCPDEPETYNGTDDEDGCPDEGDVVVTSSSINILKKVFFEYNSDQISEVSFPILDTVALTVINNPQINLVEVQGHADERGGERYNLVLTTKRAASVVRYLTGKGVPNSKIRSMGYGEFCPVDTAKNEAAYDANRRVEFKIIQMNGMPTGVDPACPRARRMGVAPPN